MSMPPVFELLARAEALLALRRWAEAQRFALDALAVEPQDEGAHALLARALAEQGLHDEAIATTEKGLAANPASEWLHRVRSSALLAAHRYEDAFLGASEALTLLPMNGSAHHLRSLALQGLGRLHEARVEAERAVTLSPESAEFRAALGDAWLNEDPPRAELLYRESLAMAPEQPLVLNNLSVALRRQRRRSEAALALKSALLLDPTLPLPKWNVFSLSNPVRLAPTPLLASIALQMLAVGLAYDSMTRRNRYWLTLGIMMACEVVSLGMVAWARKIGFRRLRRLDPQLYAIRRALEADVRARRLESVVAPAKARRVALAIGAFGAVILLGSLVGEIFLVRHYLAFPKTPRRVTLEESRSGEWAELEGVILDCASRLDLAGYTYFSGKGSGDRELVVSYEDAPTCAQAGSRLVGVVSDLPPSLASRLARNGFSVRTGHAAKLCTRCGPRESLLGIGLLAVFGALGGLTAWWSGRDAQKVARQ
jgi:tetratricopeptide (TPR) repeat protein